MSSSSESEDDELFKEALAPGFTIESVQRATSSKLQPQTTTKSLRIRDDEANQSQSNYQGVTITPQQQKFIAKKLDEYLDKKVKETDLLTKAWEGKAPKRSIKSKGIRLLSTSKKHIKHRDVIEEPEQVQMKPHKAKKRKIEGDTDNLSATEKFQAAAVTPEWVLEGKGVFGKNCCRGEVITGAVHSWTQNNKK